MFGQPASSGKLFDRNKKYIKRNKDKENLKNYYNHSWAILFGYTF